MHLLVGARHGPDQLAELLKVSPRRRVAEQVVRPPVAGQRLQETLARGLPAEQALAAGVEAILTEVESRSSSHSRYLRALGRGLYRRGVRRDVAVTNSPQNSENGRNDHGRAEPRRPRNGGG